MVRVYTRQKSCWFLRNLVQIEGSVFPTSVLVSLPPAIIAGIMVPLHATDIFEKYSSGDPVSERVFTNSAVWSGFTFLVGFMVVFRTSHAYNRFWEACASVRKMGADWFDSCSALMSFSRTSQADPDAVLAFQNKVIRLFSMLHAVALAELEDLDNGADAVEVRSLEIELVDAGAFDEVTLANVRDSTCRVELVYQWIQGLVVEAMEQKILTTPPPILTRAFHELSNGMVSFHDALKVADTPFPFPYSQTCDALLFAQYITAPFVVSAYVPLWWLSAFFCFIVIFTFACLTLTGLELEFPYGRDANDIQGHELQLEMNHKLRLLVSRSGWTLPQLRQDEDQLPREMQVRYMRQLNEDLLDARRSLLELWTALPRRSGASSRRFEVSHRQSKQAVIAKRGMTSYMNTKSETQSHASHDTEMTGNSNSVKEKPKRHSHRIKSRRLRVVESRPGGAADSYLDDPNIDPMTSSQSFTGLHVGTGSMAASATSSLDLPAPPPITGGRREGMTKPSLTPTVKPTGDVSGQSSTTGHWAATSNV
mmetsp:Transcript_60801/g.144879  ORF Transcript_60801/g.144879 Transcript_60801/m.144879 type:complete len:537 (+) Transcript_60801:84-1694(+)